MISPYLFKSNEKDRERIRIFYKNLDTPVDESTEIKAAEIDRTSIAGFIGKVAMLMGCLVGLFVFIPGTLQERLTDLALAAVLFGFGLCLVIFRKK